MSLFKGHWERKTRLTVFCVIPIACSPRLPNRRVRLLISVTITSNPIPATNPIPVVCSFRNGDCISSYSSAKGKELVEKP